MDRAPARTFRCGASAVAALAVMASVPLAGCGADQSFIAVPADCHAIRSNVTTNVRWQPRTLRPSEERSCMFYTGGWAEMGDGTTTWKVPYVALRLNADDGTPLQLNFRPFDLVGTRNEAEQQVEDLGEDVTESLTAVREQRAPDFTRVEADPNLMNVVDFPPELQEDRAGATEAGQAFGNLGGGYSIAYPAHHPSNRDINPSAGQLDVITAHWPKNVGEAGFLNIQLKNVTFLGIDDKEIAEPGQSVQLSGRVAIDFRVRKPQ